MTQGGKLLEILELETQICIEMKDRNKLESNMLFENYERSMRDPCIKALLMECAGKVCMLDANWSEA